MILLINQSLVSLLTSFYFVIKILFHYVLLHAYHTHTSPCIHHVSLSPIYFISLVLCDFCCSSNPFVILPTRQIPAVLHKLYGGLRARGPNFYKHNLLEIWLKFYNNIFRHPSAESMTVTFSGSYPKVWNNIIGKSTLACGTWWRRESQALKDMAGVEWTWSWNATRIKIRETQG